MEQTIPLLHSHQLHFQRQGKTLLNDISLTLPQGKITMLIGPNGAGKSTLLRILSGYLKQTGGECHFHGKPITHYEAKELAKQRAVMRQHSQLNFPFSVEEVIRMGGYHRRSQEIEKYLPEVIALTDCEPLKDKTYRQLSGGEQQRVQLARSLLQLWGEDMNGKLLFLDEPTSAFDLRHQQQCLRLIHQLCEQRGLTVCCVLHDLNLASLYGDHIVLLADQQLQAQGRAKDILTKEIICRWYNADIEIQSHALTQTPQIIFKR
ncbi:heme ABC transporter ATP-binding protein [Vespertiliibacter pulmonis]|uniref:Iron complex transport system ATP-binding protein n=2 Tax=Vespertiliibacter pulmonis TaxID=1443036 RepID=A0A3N4VKV3_9PAST|nr:heme ABC transporter ATP-binding protein [Vespertiliibacter pulmonis]QLB21150.1 heme ABC transporter ATP-binding protein [Vespertiliibacter pulmonis]RPE83746.1 iron complex transport system ATP-binding protein [Vespertiliibacter pulmonis]